MFEDDEDPAVQELAQARNAAELYRLLVQSRWGWGSSTRHHEAVSLLRDLPSETDVPSTLVALLLSTCGRWDRVTAKLIAGIEESGVLTGPDLDDRRVADQRQGDCCVSLGLDLRALGGVRLRRGPAPDGNDQRHRDGAAGTPCGTAIAPMGRQQVAAQGAGPTRGPARASRRTAATAPGRSPARPSRRSRLPGQRPTAASGPPGPQQRYRPRPASRLGSAVPTRRPRRSAAPCPLGPRPDRARLAPTPGPHPASAATRPARLNRRLTADERGLGGTPQCRPCLDRARGWRLADLRKRRGLTQAEVAARMDVSTTRISLIENGDISTQDVLQRYVAALGGALKLIADFGDEQLKIA